MAASDVSVVVLAHRAAAVMTSMSIGTGVAVFALARLGGTAAGFAGALGLAASASHLALTLTILTLLLDL